jgi:hypothetical protein
MKTILYIDGFNLYFSAVKGTPLRWLNPVALVQNMFPRNQIVSTKYFTARVSALPDNPDQPMRQDVYWRALRTLPNFVIIEGKFRTRQIRAKVVNPPPNTMEVFKTEEKGSDVNLGAHLLIDAFYNRFEAAIVITGDSDLITPIEMVNNDLRKPVGVLNPQRLSGPGRQAVRSSAGLQQAARFYKNGVRWEQLVQAQFPDTMEDSSGSFTKPSVWR